MIIVGWLGMVVISGFLLGLVELFKLGLRIMPSILTGMAAMLAIGFLCADRRDKLIMNNRWMPPAWGLATFMTGALVGCSVNTFCYSGLSFDYENYLIKPLFWLWIIGFLPSMVVGQSYVMFGDPRPNQSLSGSD